MIDLNRDGSSRLILSLLARNIFHVNGSKNMYFRGVCHRITRLSSFWCKYNVNYYVKYYVDKHFQFDTETIYKSSCFTLWYINPFWDNLHIFDHLFGNMQEKYLYIKEEKELLRLSMKKLKLRKIKGYTKSMVQIALNPLCHQVLVR